MSEMYYYIEDNFFKKSERFTHNKKYTIIKDNSDIYYVLADDKGRVHNISEWFLERFFITHREMIIQKLLKELS